MNAHMLHTLIHTCMQYISNTCTQRFSKREKKPTRWTHLYTHAIRFVITIYSTDLSRVFYKNIYSHSPLMPITLSPIRVIFPSMPPAYHTSSVFIPHLPYVPTECVYRQSNVYNLSPSFLRAVEFTLPESQHS